MMRVTRDDRHEQPPAPALGEPRLTYWETRSLLITCTRCPWAARCGTYAGALIWEDSHAARCPGVLAAARLLPPSPTPDPR